MKRAIHVETTSGARVQVLARLIGSRGLFAVHREPEATRWQITHTKTGKRIIGGFSHREAIRLAQAMDDERCWPIPWSWTADRVFSLNLDTLRAVVARTL